jgi:outer membrane protein TolC
MAGAAKQGLSAVSLTALLVLGACSFAPPLKVPVVPAPDTFKEQGAWTPAVPGDRLPRDSWWDLYDTAEIGELEQRLIAGNPSLAAALANYAEAKAQSDQARAALLPTIGASAGASRNQESRHAPLIGPTTPRYYNDDTLSGSLSRGRSERGGVSGGLGERPPLPARATCR